MSLPYLHQHNDFSGLLRILEEQTQILAGLIEKDYWIMHVLNGLKKQGFDFELKGGTSLSKGYGIIDRFSEDIDIHITPPKEFNINENPKNTNPKTAEARKRFYDWLAETIQIEGIVSIERDHAFDDTDYYRSGGIRLYYQSQTDAVSGIKEGILLEAGFDTVTPNQKRLISSWAYERVKSNSAIEVVDNRAVDIPCYHPGYTFVEKLQTIATKFRQMQNGVGIRPNLMRQYYDVARLLDHPDVQEFIGTPAYHAHKNERFPVKDKEIPIKENGAFLLSDPKLRATFRKRYKETASLYYKGQPDFDSLLNKIKEHIGKL